MKRLSLILVILFGLNAVVWTMRAVSVVLNGKEDFILSVICAACWVVSFVLQIIAYRSKKGE